MHKFIFPGNPVAQQRFRAINKGGKSWLFDPQGKEKKIFSAMAKDQLDDNWQPPKYPKVNFWFLMPIPKSMPTRERLQAEAGHLKHVKKPDIDNLIKFYLDILTPHVLEDDNCVSIGKAYKLYSSNPRTVIFIEETDKLITNKELGDY